uniref:Putative secreted peptide n=1 Tax=Anopheles braziliensis TaxID=58242 RepID=A0A2M3ZTB7_9DIPT
MWRVYFVALAPVCGVVGRECFFCVVTSPLTATPLPTHPRVWLSLFLVLHCVVFLIFPNSREEKSAVKLRLALPPLHHLSWGAPLAVFCALKPRHHRHQCQHSGDHSPLP